jgi:hypothetical protein
MEELKLSNSASASGFIRFMPVLGTADPPPQQPLFYRSLQEFDGWSPGGDHDETVKFKPRNRS